MKLMITGTPGTGKTDISKVLAKVLKLELINEKQFALKKGIGEWDTLENELEIPIKKLERELNLELMHKKNVIVEGHLLCETKLKVDYAILLRIHPEVLETRLESRGYSMPKVQDNVFAEGIDYCKKHLEKIYPKSKIIEVNASKSVKETAKEIISELEKRKQ